MSTTGVLALQGDFEAHERVVRSIGAETIQVRTPEDLESAERLIIPGGESTTITKLAIEHGLAESLRKRANGGMPIFGTCAGMIVCAARIADGDEPLIGIADLTVRRNAYGRQVDSFESTVEVTGVGAVRAVFIRAPWVEETGPGVEILATHGNRPVAVRQDRVLLCSFHPELVGEDRLHRLFLSM